MPIDAIRQRLAEIAPVSTTDLPELGVRVHVATSPAPPVPVLFPPTLYLVFQGSKRLLFGDREFLYSAGEMVALAVRTPGLTEIVGASADEPYRALELPFDRLLVTAIVAQLESRAATPSAAMSLHALPEHVLDPVGRLLALAGDETGARILAEGIKREIWYRILTGPSGGAFVELVRTDSILGGLQHATDWLHEHLDEPVDVRRLATLANMSVTSLHRHFKGATGTSPGAFHKQLRLIEARRLVAARTDTIQRIAESVGYSSASQFTRDYKRAFGASPRSDGRLLRTP